MFHVKVRKKGTKQFSFLSSGGTTNRLRVHALQFDTREKADTMVTHLRADNPDWEAVVRPVD